MTIPGARLSRSEAAKVSLNYIVLRDQHTDRFGWQLSTFLTEDAATFPGPRETYTGNVRRGLTEGGCIVAEKMLITIDTSKIFIRSTGEVLMPYFKEPYPQRVFPMNNSIVKNLHIAVDYEGLLLFVGKKTLERASIQPTAGNLEDEMDRQQQREMIKQTVLEEVYAYFVNCILAGVAVMLAEMQMRFISYEMEKLASPLDVDVTRGTQLINQRQINTHLTFSPRTQIGENLHPVLVWMMQEIANFSLMGALPYFTYGVVDANERGLYNDKQGFLVFVPPQYKNVLHKSGITETVLATTAEWSFLRALPREVANSTPDSNVYWANAGEIYFKSNDMWNKNKPPAVAADPDRSKRVFYVNCDVRDYIIATDDEKNGVVYEKLSKEQNKILREERGWWYPSLIK